jgi:hypothetical protein
MARNQYFPGVKMDNKTLRQNEKKIQIGLVDFFFAEGYKIDAYVDPYTGGIYENKLENKLGLQISDKSPSPDFLLACQNLEELGYVRRIQRNPNIKLMGIWPTRLGINQYEYWKAN